MSTASQTMIARVAGRQTQRFGFIVLAISALVLLVSLAVQLALTHPLLDGTEQAQ